MFLMQGPYNRWDPSTNRTVDVDLLGVQAALYDLRDCTFSE